MADDIPKFSETLRIAIESKLIDLHTALPVEVVSFNSTKQTVTCKIVVKRIKQTDVVEEFPLLVDVPVAFTQTKEFAITFPIKAGDTGQVLFNERQIDNWEINGDILPPDDARMHSLSDGVFYPQLTNQKKNIPNFNTTDLEIRTNNSNGKICIAPNGKLELERSGQKVLEELSNALGVLGVTDVTVTTGSSAGTYPINQQSQFLALQVIIDNIRK